MTCPEIDIRDLEFERAGDVVLSIATLQIAAARTTALLGPNGSGKTTLLRLISGLERPQRGSIHIGERCVDSVKPSTDQVAFAFQKAVSIRGSVRSNLELALRLRGLDASERRARIDEIADQLGIHALLERLSHELSHGEAQRMNLARALSLRAPVTLLDEPFAGLDTTRSRMLDQLPGWLAEPPTTAIVVTHDRDEALRIADDLVLLDMGNVVASGPVAKLLEMPPNARAAELLGFALLSKDGVTVAVPADALVVGGAVVGDGRAEATFRMRIERVVDLGIYREAIGLVGDTPVRTRLPADVELRAGELHDVHALLFVVLAGGHQND